MIYVVNLSVVIGCDKRLHRYRIIDWQDNWRERFALSTKVWIAPSFPWALAAAFLALAFALLLSFLESTFAEAFRSGRRLRSFGTLRSIVICAQTL